MRKVLKNITCFALGMILVLGLACTSVSAAESCTSVTGSSASTKTFKVKVSPKTYGYDYIKFTHTQKGKYSYEYKLFGYWTGNHKSKSAYGYYTVTIKNSKGDTVKTVKWENTKSLKINFGTWFKYKGSQFGTETYTITIKPYTKSQMRKVAHYGFDKWLTNSKWKVYKTRGVVSCW